MDLEGSGLIPFLLALGLLGKAQKFCKSGPLYKK